MPSNENHEFILISWNLMPSYRRHRYELREFALKVCLIVCRMHRGLPGVVVITQAKCQEEFRKRLEQHPLFTKTILQQEKPHIPPSMYQTLGKSLAYYVVEQHWQYITSHPCQ